MLLDHSLPWQLGFQDPASPSMLGIIILHDFVFSYLILVVWLIVILLINLKYFEYSLNPISMKFENHHTSLEIFWTIVPAAILVTIAIPSFQLLYFADDLTNSKLSIKVIGNQWFWSYFYFAN